MIYRGSATEVILKILLYSTLRYSDVERLVRGSSGFEKTNKATIHATLSRLKRRGFVSRTSRGWRATKRAEKYLKQIEKKLPKGNYPSFKRKKGEHIIIAYDIPEVMKEGRDWLRVELRMLSFKQMQKSVWIGPAPLPEIFIARLKEADLLGYMNFFVARKKEIV